MRHAVLPLVQHDAKKAPSVEALFHALRVMHSVGAAYTMLARQSDASVNSMTNIALTLTSATTQKQLQQALRFRLSELSIPGIILCLSPFMAKELVSTEIALIVPELPPDLSRMLPYKVREPAVFPKRLLPKPLPLQLTLELLFHNGMYLGYAYLFMGSTSFALYDNVKELLSQTLFNLYAKESKTKSHALIITDRQKLTNAVHIEETAPVRHSKLDAKRVTDYLLDHLDEMTDLDKMAASFSLSKSHLTRRCRELTGYSVQTLHERLKIEQAKDLIKSGKMKMNDISIRLGFSNPNYFSNVFKKVTGLSPVAWAERNRKLL